MLFKLLERKDKHLDSYYQSTKIHITDYSATGKMGDKGKIKTLKIILNAFPTSTWEKKTAYVFLQAS